MMNDHLTVLIVDDDSSSVKHTAGLINAFFQAVNVLTASTPQEALKIAVNRTPDAVFFGISADKERAYAFCHELNTVARDAYIIGLTTNHSDPDIYRNDLEKGFFVILSKPLQERDVITQIKTSQRIKDLVFKSNQFESQLQILAQSTKNVSIESKPDLLEQAPLSEHDHAIMQAFFESMPGYAYIYDENGKLIKWNKKHETMTGYSGEELAEMSLDRWFKAKDLEKVHQAVSEVFTHGYGNVEASLHLKNGETMLTRSSGVPLLLSGKNYFAGVGIDITEFRNLEQQLKKTIDDLKASQQIAHLGTWRLDLTTNEVVWSEELYKMYGFDPTIPPPPYTEHMKLFTPESWAALSKSLELTRTTGIPYELELETITSDQSHGWMWVRGQAEKDETGKIVSLWGAAQDITKYKRVERDLATSEAKFQLLFDKAPLGYQSLDAEGNFLEVNQAWLDALGYQRDEVIGRWFGDLLVADNVDEFRRRFPIFKSQGSIHSEFEMLSKSGQRIFISFEGKIAYGTDHAFMQTHCILKDITKEKIAEKALRESEERYKNLFENSGVGFGYITKEGIVISYNKVAIERLGLTLEDCAGKSIHTLFPTEIAKLMQSRIDQAILSEDSLEFEDYVPVSQGLRGYSSVFKRIANAAGEFTNVQIASIDITDRMLAEEVIKKQNDLFATLLEVLPVGVFMVDAKDGRPIISNSTSLDLLGRGLLPGATEHNLSEVYRAFKGDGEKTYPVDEMPITLGMKGISAHIDDMVVERPDGSRKLLEVIGTPIKDAKGKTWASLATFMDITERKNSENKLLYMALHDPLTGLYNRRFFESEIKRVDVVENLPLSIIMIDINGLKLINDSFGHDTGDTILQKTADTIRKFGRKTDIVARIGGDEFAIVMPKTTDLEAKRISSSIESTIYTENVLNIKLTLSCGYDTKLTMNQSLNEVIANADNFMYRHKIYEYSSAKSKTIDIILKALFEKSQREAEHSLRVGDLSEAIATELGLDHEVIIRTKAAGRVHDIGKIGINENILNKPTRLDDNEWSQIKRHPEIGWRILSASNEFFELANFVLNHHERWDGTGYPNGIKTESIPMESRIIALSDAFDAMTSDRSYRNQISVDQAIRVIIECSGTQFDPRVVEAFLRFVDKSPNHLLITK